MKVALELQPCCWSRSGIGTYTYEIARRLHNSEDFTFFGNAFCPVWKRGSSDGLSGISIPIRKNELLPYGVYRRIWNAFPRDYQDIFSPSVDLSVFFNFIVPPRISGKVITTVHDLTIIRHPETMKRTNYKHIADGLKRSVERSDRVIVVSEFTKRELHELMGVPEEKIRVVPSAPSIHESPVSSFAEIASRYGIQNDYILFVGTIEPRKNIVRLLQAFDKLKTEKNITEQLVLAGGDGWEDKEIYQVLSQSRYKSDVIITGFIDEPSKVALYQHAKAFVFPSIYEGFGIPPLEAMACGCPTVCADISSLPEVVGDASFLINPLDIDSITDGIYTVLNNEPLREKLVAKGRTQVQKYTWDKTVKTFLEVIAET